MEPIRKAFCALIKKRKPVNTLQCFIGDIPCTMKSCKVRISYDKEIKRKLHSIDFDKELKQIEAEIAAEQW